MSVLLHDLRYAVRSLLRSPGLTLTALLTLALGIGANTALFSLINGALWSPPPGVREADGLLRISHMSEARQGRRLGVSYLEYLNFRDRSGVFADLAAFMGTTVAFAAGGEPEQVLAELVTGDYFATLRVRPALGRGILPEENRSPGAHPVAVISHEVWQEYFGGAHDVLGRSIAVNGSNFTVVGVAPDGFRGLSGMQSPADLWLPVMMYGVAKPGWDSLREVSDDFRDFQSVGRLRPGMPRTQALAILTTLTSQQASEHPEAYERISVGLFPLGRAAGELGGDLPIALFAMGVTLVVLLIACANLANLQLARAARRRREIAVRAALGASRQRIVRQLLTESLLLAGAGGAAGVLVAVFMVELFIAVAPIPFPMPVALNGTALLATLGLSLLTGLAFGLSPALRASNAELTPELKGADSVGARRIRPQNTLVAIQIAFSFMLLVGAGLLVRSMWDILVVAHTQPARDEVLVLSMDLEAQGYSDEASLVFKQTLLERTSAVGQVESASIMSVASPMSGPEGGRVTLEAGATGAEGSPQPQRVTRHRVWPDFFRTTGLTMLRGRDFTMQDRKGAPLVAIVNETAARRLWPGEDPLGQQFRIGSDTVPWTTVVGVVADAGFDRPRGAETEPAVYSAELQHGSFRQTGLLVRSRGDRAGLARELREQVHAIDPNLPVLRVRTLGQMIDERYAEGWLAGGLMVVFGALAFILALIGLHGVVAYTVVQRTREVGIRISLGATQGQILGLFGRDVLRVASAGLGVGVVLAAGIVAMLSAMMADLKPTDTLTFAGIACLLLAVTLLASYFPARRATKVDPMVALRTE
jgi:putative ABC transport system permease protein